MKSYEYINFVCSVIDEFRMNLFRAGIYWVVRPQSGQREALTDAAWRHCTKRYVTGCVER